MQEMRVWSLGQEDPLEWETATYYPSILAWKIPGTEEPGRLQSMQSQRVGWDRGWDGWMASPTRWTWVWVNSGSWWWTGRPGVLRFMESQSRTRLNWTEHTHTISAHESCRAGFVMRISMAHGSPFVLEPQPEQKECPLTLSLFWLVTKSSSTTEYEVSEFLFDLFRPLVQLE